MKVNQKRNYQRITAILAFFVIMVTIIPTYAKANSDSINYYSQYITVDEKEMRVVLYGNLTQTGSDVSFTDKSKTTLVMLPALAISSPHLYFKPLAQALDTDFNVVIIEPFGYGLSDLASTARSVENINAELNEALNVLDIDECVLLVHSISGIYGLDFVFNYPDKVKGFIAVDNTIYDDEIQDALAMEREYMLKGIEEFNTIRNSFPSIQDFQLAIEKEPAKYGVALPEIVGYTYPESDMEEYIQAYSLGFNESIENEINQTEQSSLTIKGKKFPDSLPVLMMISSNNVENVPAWETGHYNQLNSESANHELYILEGSHYIWYTNLSGIVNHINDWKANHQF